LKIDSSCLFHKTDIGALALNIRDEEELRKAFLQLGRRVKQEGLPTAGILIQRWVPEGIEMILGGRVDRNFGPVIMLGFGGIYAEFFEDIALRIGPLCERDAEEMIGELKGARILEGARGKVYDLPFLKDAVLRLSHLMACVPQIKGIDLNPLMLFTERKGGMAVDARVVVDDASG